MFLTGTLVRGNSCFPCDMHEQRRFPISITGYEKTKQLMSVSVIIYIVTATLYPSVNLTIALAKAFSPMQDFWELYFATNSCCQGIPLSLFNPKMKRRIINRFNHQYLRTLFQRRSRRYLQDFWDFCRSTVASNYDHISGYCTLDRFQFLGLFEYIILPLSCG